MIPRRAEPTLRRLADQFKAVALVGPRQSGKTTLARHVFDRKPYVNLENPDSRRFAMEDPRGFLQTYPNGAVIDEAQRVPELFSWLQGILDDSARPGQFVLTGSNNFLLQQSVSQSLAGRIAYLYLLPFSTDEIRAVISPEGLPQANEILVKGGYPPVYDQPVESGEWYRNYVRTYIERDVRQIRNITDLTVFERFVRLCAGRTGQLLNKHSLAIETGVDTKTVESWIGVLESSFVLFRLFPNHRNFNKRVVKMPKLYFYDTGLVCTLLGIQTANQLSTHPARGAIFETYVVSELKKALFNQSRPDDLTFWRDNTGREIDVILDRGGELSAVEIKSGQTVTADFFKGVRFWQKLTGHSEGFVVHGGDQHQLRSDGIHVLPWSEAATIMD